MKKYKSIIRFKNPTFTNEDITRFKELLIEMNKQPITIVNSEENKIQYIKLKHRLPRKLKKKLK